jgi:hypothetical protein
MTALIIIDALNWQRLLPSMGNVKLTSRPFGSGSLDKIAEFEPPFHEDPKLAVTDHQVETNESELCDNSIDSFSQSFHSNFSQSFLRGETGARERNSSMNPYTGKMETENDAGQAKAMALIEAAREESLNSKIKKVMASGFSHNEATRALMLVSTANEAIYCLQNPERLESLLSNNNRRSIKS